MERARRIQSFWAWLPAFRAVAETQHLPTASRSLHVTPSALSRTVRLLEDAVGEPLFLREGRSLKLAPAGEVLLTAVREAMRRVHEGLLEVEGMQHSGPVHVTVTGPFAPIVLLPALIALEANSPGLVPCVRPHPGPGEVNSLLHQGAIDLALLDDALPDEELHIERLLTLRHDVCCAPKHPLVAVDDLDRALAEVPFAAPLAGRDGHRPDAWPAHRDRRVTLEVYTMQTALDAVASGSHVACLPVLVARAAGLVPLGVPDMLSTDLCLAQRNPLPGVSGRADELARALREHVSTLDPD